VPLRFDVISLFPEMFAAVTDYGITRRAFEKGLVELACWNPREFTHDRHRTVDDRPYGGGPGMVMLYQPLADAVRAAQVADERPLHLIYLSPQGVPLNQKKVEQLVQMPRIGLLCGRYEGVDERFVSRFVDEEVSIGDFVVSGGELPAMMLIDAVIRLLPGALGHDLSAVEDSFTDGLLDCPHYTRPPEIDGMTVPEVLQQGHHEQIAIWRLLEKLKRTAARRPDLLNNLVLTSDQRTLLKRALKMGHVSNEQLIEWNIKLD
jgi:tRNA (guanine37-N1)-methyltransferase